MVNHPPIRHQPTAGWPASPTASGIFARQPGGKTGRLSRWLKHLCRRVYTRAVYCKVCGDEIGTNPECRECARTMRPWSPRA